MGSLLTYEGLPESFKKEVFVRSKVEEDPDVLKERQDLVKNMKPAQLGNIGGLSDFPLPEKLDTMMRPSKRNLKSTKKKEESKRRYISVSLALLARDDLCQKCTFLRLRDVLQGPSMESNILLFQQKLG